jgi:DNA mismatch endonuclease (patch repair protein)
MVDVVDRATRSRMMAGIRGRNTKPEVQLRSALHRLGVRFRVHDRRLIGRPDIVLPKYRAVVQVHGCFWHRHERCRFATTPSSNHAFWDEKFKANVARDQRSEAALRKLGWRIAIVWECAIRERGAEAIAGETLNWLSRIDSGAPCLDLQIPPQGSF